MQTQSTPDPAPGARRPPVFDEGEGGLLRFIEVLESIDTAKPLAKLNETTISDNNGGRIEL